MLCRISVSCVVLCGVVWCDPLCCCVLCVVVCCFLLCCVVGYRVVLSSVVLWYLVCCVLCRCVMWPLVAFVVWPCAPLCRAELCYVYPVLALLVCTLRNNSKATASRELQEVTGLSLHYQLFPGAADVCARTLMICPVCDVLSIG